MGLRANEVIEGAWDFLSTGIKKGYLYMNKASEKKTFGGLAKAAFESDGNGLLDFASKAADGTVTHYSGARMLGTASALGIGYRFASGGGIYRDKNGNTDLAGVPFI